MGGRGGDSNSKARISSPAGEFPRLCVPSERGCSQDACCRTNFYTQHFGCDNSPLEKGAVLPFIPAPRPKQHLILPLDPTQEMLPQIKKKKYIPPRVPQLSLHFRLHKGQNCNLIAAPLSALGSFKTQGT
jgi:hypothetical protein